MTDQFDPDAAAEAADNARKGQTEDYLSMTDEEHRKIDAGLEAFLAEFRGTGILAVTVNPTHYPIVTYMVKTANGSYHRRRNVSND